MKVSVIVTACDSQRFKEVVEAVGSLLDQTYCCKEIIVVVDRNEMLYSKLISVLPSRIKIILNNKAGLSNSRNLGIKHATGEIICFLDDDAIAEKNWLSILVRNYDDPTVIGVGGCIKPLWLCHPKYKYPQELFWIIGCTYKGAPETKSVVRNTFGSNLSFRSEIFRNLEFCSVVGKNGNAQLDGEETELSIRAKRLFPGSKIIYDPEALVFHRIYPFRLSIPYAIKRAYGDGFSKAFISKNLKGNSLSTENKYLENLLLVVLPEEAKSLFSRKRKTQAVRNITLDLAVIIFVFVGFLVGNFSW
jgi:glucosyl-dolichyl phosphate glucuronosyltransferase